MGDDFTKARAEYLETRLRELKRDTQIAFEEMERRGGPSIDLEGVPLLT
jgi:hypothetical protein